MSMRYTPTDILSTYAAITALNANFDEIATLFEKCVFVDGTAPNQMEADLDLNHFKVQNVANGVNAQDAVSLSQVQTLIGSAISTSNAYRIDPRVLEVKADGTTNDTAAMQTAINLAASLHLPVMLPNNCVLGALTIPANCSIISENTSTKIVSVAGNYDQFTITGSDVLIDCVYLDASLKTGGYCFNLSVGITLLERINILNVVTFGDFGGVKDSGSTGTFITTSFFNVKFRALRGPAWNLTKGAAFLYLNQCTADYVGVSASNFTGFSVTMAGLAAGSGGLYMTDCQVLGTAGTYNNTSQHAFSISNASDVKLLRCQADTVAGKGFVFNTINKLDLQGTEAGLCGDRAYEFTAVTNSSFNGIKGYGRNGLGYAPAATDGLVFVSGCHTISVMGGLMRDFTGNGTNKLAAQAGAININGMQFNSNVGRGIKTTGASSFVVMGGATIGNTAGNYDLGNALDIIVNVVLNSGSVSATVTGVATG